MSAFAAFAGIASADDLPRRGLMGVQLDATGEDGVAIMSITPDTAAASAGLLAGDVIIEIDDQPTPDWSTLAPIASGLKAGVPTTLTIERGDAQLELELVPTAMPVEQMAGADVELGVVTSANGDRMRTIITVPVGALDAPRPAVLLLQGIPCQTIELSSPANPYYRMLKATNDAGFITMRCEKPGVGDSEGTPCADGGFDDEVLAYQAALVELASDPRVDAERIYIVGISMGGFQAALVADAAPVAGVVTFGSGTQPWFEYWISNFRERRLLSGEDPNAVDQSMRVWRDVFAKLLIDEMTPEQVLEALPAAELLTGLDLERPAGRHYTFHQELDDANIIGAWADYARSGGTLLAVHGEFDWIASLHDHKMAATVVDLHSPLDDAGEFVIIPGMDHAFTVHRSLIMSFQRFGQGESSDAFATLATGWLAEQAGVEG
ncbi:MAG: alpha/beta fold hydrolase [Planctomycetota bacterium]